MNKGWIIGIAVFGVLVWMRFSDQSETNQTTKADMVEIVQNLDCYAENAVALDEMCDYAHEDAFEQCYDMGGRRESASFDGEKYLTLFVDSMVSEARMRKMGQSVVDELDSLRHQVVYR